jgi:hypothetical protein
MTPSQASFATAAEVPWTGNVGAKRFFLGTPEAEGLSDEDLYRLFTYKEGDIFAAKNSRTPFQYMKSPPQARPTQRLALFCPYGHPFRLSTLYRVYQDV